VSVSNARCFYVAFGNEFRDAGSDTYKASPAVKDFSSFKIKKLRIGVLFSQKGEVFCDACNVLFVVITGIFYEVVMQISMLFINNKNYVFCIYQ